MRVAGAGGHLPLPGTVRGLPGGGPRQRAKEGGMNHMGILKTIWSVIRDVFYEWNKDDVPRLGAALSYYTVFSIAPLLIIVVAIAGAVFGEKAATGELQRQIEGLIDKQGAKFITDMLNGANAGGHGLV